MTIDLGKPAVLDFTGPDAVRFLNGQMTQDVRKVVANHLALPSCITDAKGKLQFRVWFTSGPAPETIRIIGEPGTGDQLLARLTRYLIADDVETADLSGSIRMLHLSEHPSHGNFKIANRFGFDGYDVCSSQTESIGDTLSTAELLALRVNNCIPAWGRELNEGLLPPEAGLDATDISYSKGCYIGQEVISRIKSAGKLNRRLVKFHLTTETETPATLTDADGKIAGEITSSSGLDALGFIKRSMEDKTLFLNGQAVSQSNQKKVPPGNP